MKKTISIAAVITIAFVFAIFAGSGEDKKGAWESTKGLAIQSTLGAVPEIMNYQGVLTDQNGMLLHGPYTLTFRIYDHETAGTLIWWETHSSVQIDSGLVNVLLGTVSPGLAESFDESNRWLEVEVQGQTTSPRQPIASVPYAFSSGNGSGGGCWECPYAPGSGPVYTLLGNVGIGTTAPLAKLHVKGNAYPSSFIFIESDTDEDAGFRIYEGSTVKYHIYNDASKDLLRIDGGDLRIEGKVGIGTPSPSEKLTVRGNILIESQSTGDPVVELGEGLDYAEGFDVSDHGDIGPGAVLIIDPAHPGTLTLSSTPYDNKVAGIVAGAKGMGSGVRLGANQFDYDVALAGRVYCNVDATEAEVEPGDLLTTSATPGYAMKATDSEIAQGAILGKAMESLAQGEKGQILVLVTLQ